MQAKPGHFQATPSLRAVGEPSQLQDGKPQNDSTQKPWPDAKRMQNKLYGVDSNH